MTDRRAVTIVVHVDGDVESRQYRISLRLFRAAQTGAIVVAVLVTVFFALAGPITRNAARVPGLEREVNRLKQDNARVQQLAAALNRAEANYQEVRQLLGARVPAPRSDAGVVLMQAVPVRARAPAAPRRYAAGPTPP
ncbi:MAG: hypothetical protein ACREMV_03255, partial [Gemmatimonadales bacterium]